MITASTELSHFALCKVIQEHEDFLSICKVIAKKVDTLQILLGFLMTMTIIMS